MPDLLVPGDARGLLDGWCGPCRWRLSPDTDSYDDGVVVGDELAYPGRVVVRLRDGITAQTPDRIRLDAARAEVRDRLVRWAATGERCPACEGRIASLAAGEWTRAPIFPQDCCRGSGYLRPPHDLRPFLDYPSGPLTPEVSGALLAWSVREIAAGRGPIGGVMLLLDDGRVTAAYGPCEGIPRGTALDLTIDQVLARRLALLDPSGLRMPEVDRG